MICIIMRGLPGSGKTTYVKGRESLRGYRTVSADHFFYDRSTDGKTYAFDPTLLPEAHAKCRQDFRDTLRSGHKVIVDNTNLSAAEIAWYYCEAEDAGYDVEVRTLDVEFSVCFERQDKGIPLDTMVRMNQSFVNAELPPWWTQMIVECEA